MSATNLLNEPVNGAVDVSLTVCLVNDVSNILMLRIYIRLVWLCSKKPIATGSNSRRSLALVVCSKNSATCHRSRTNDE